MPEIGQGFSHYSIVEKIGSGGMGEVYVADDLNLNRKVALKFLPDAFAGDAERMARFEREAKLLASLNHPNIAAIYGLEQAEGKRFLVLEFVKGETLAQRIDKGALPVDDALAICRQIADGLEAAHDKGVIHRDLKPANVMITNEDKVKVLDFGLAKALSDDTGGLDSSQSPTLTEAMTRPGVILGTAAYMSPEQAKGKSVDKRADIWAFGCILYECLTGRRAFEGETTTETLAAILRAEPNWQALPGNTPPNVILALRRCLDKDLSRRLRDAADVRIEIDEVRRTGYMAGPSKRFVSWPAWTVALVAVAVAVAAVIAGWMKPEPPAPALARFSVTAPSEMMFVVDGASIAVSPDGRGLAFIATDSTGVTKLCARKLDSLSAQPMPGTDAASLPFWSPDGRFVGFFAEGKLKKIPADGGSPEVICDAPGGRGASWGKSGAIIFAPQAMGSLFMVSANGGNPVEVARPDSSKKETGLRFPNFLPDGAHYLYVSLPAKPEGYDVYLGKLGSDRPERIMVADGSPVPAAGYLLYANGNRIVAQEFDRDALRPRGEIMPLGNAPPASSFAGSSLVSASENGVLVHTAANPPKTQLVWFDRQGESLATIPIPPAAYSSPSISPDGRWAAVSIINSPTSYDLWLVDLQRAVTTRLTFDGLAAGGTGLGASVIWSSDGTRVVYQSLRSGIYDVYQVLTNGTGKPEPLVQSSVVFKMPASWSPDGKYLVWIQNTEQTQWDIWLLPMQGDRKPIPFLRTPFDENTAAISPDGRWMAYDSNETGRPEIYVRSFPEPREKHRISISGGSNPQWSSDGRELIFWTSDNWAATFGSAYVVDVQTSPAFKTGPPRLLFSPRQDIMGIGATADLTRFLAAVPVPGSAPPSVTVIVNWQALLR